MHLLSDSITDENRHEFGDIAIAVLDMFAMYDRVLDVIGWYATDTLHYSRTQEDHEMSLTDFTRGRDGDQAALFVRLARIEGVPGDRSNFKNVFKRLKDTRDHVAHAGAMNAMTENGVATVGIPYYHAQRARLGAFDGARSSVTLRLMKKRCSDAQWLIDHVEWCRVYANQFGGPFSRDDYLPDEPPPPVAPRY